MEVDGSRTKTSIFTITLSSSAIILSNCCFIVGLNVTLLLVSFDQTKGKSVESELYNLWNTIRKVKSPPLFDVGYLVGSVCFYHCNRYRKMLRRLSIAGTYYN